MFSVSSISPYPLNQNERKPLKFIAKVSTTLIVLSILSTLKGRERTSIGVFSSMGTISSFLEGIVAGVKKHVHSLISKKLNPLSLCFITLFLGFPSLLGGDNHAIVMLRGTCSAGKTNICDKIKQQDPHWHVVDLDELYMKKMVELIAATFPSEYATVAQMLLLHRISIMLLKETKFV